jgi:hypothetical protein
LSHCFGLRLMTVQEFPPVQVMDCMLNFPT